MNPIEQRVTGKLYWLLMIDWAIDCLMACDNKRREAKSLMEIGMDYMNKGDMQTAEIVRQKHTAAHSMSFQLKGEAYGYLLAARVYASGHKVGPFKTCGGKGDEHGSNKR